jgi:hypothetical protein
MNDIEFDNNLGQHRLGLAFLLNDRAAIGIGYALGSIILASAVQWVAFPIVAFFWLNDDKWITGEGPKALAESKAIALPPGVANGPALPRNEPIAETPTILQPSQVEARNETPPLAPGHQPIAQNFAPAVVPTASTTPTTAIDIAASLAAPIKSSIIVGQPGAGKGLAVAYATRAIKQRHPEVSIWVIDPKSDPGEAAYWLACDRVLDEPIPAFPSGEDIEDFQGKVDRFVDEFKAVLGPKLLIVDEVLAIKELMPGWFKGFSVACNHLASTGRSRAVYVWLISQTPNASDFGISGGARNVFRRVLLLAADDLGLIANNSTFFDGKPSAALLRQTGRVAFDSLGGKWAAVPQYPDLAVSALAPTMPVQIVDEESRHDRLERIFQAPPAATAHDQIPSVSIGSTTDVSPEESAILDYCRRRNGATTRQIQQGKLPALAAFDSATIKALCDGLADDNLGRWDGLIFHAMHPD